MSAASLFRRSCLPSRRLVLLGQNSFSLNRGGINRKICKTYLSNFSKRVASKSSYFRVPPPPYRTKLLLCALSPAAFIQISENEEDAGKTAEEQMLEASRRELESYVPHYFKGSKFRQGVYFFIDHYIIEPFMTGIRFLHLAFIFIPVLCTVPAIWFGTKLPNRDSERKGAIWWYGYLVWSMEKAGASFIKVNIPSTRIQRDMR